MRKKKKFDFKSFEKRMDEMKQEAEKHGMSFIAATVLDGEQTAWAYGKRGDIYDVILSICLELLNSGGQE